MKIFKGREQKINAEKFLNAFSSVWQEQLKDRRDEIIRKYADDTLWTEFMLGKKDGLLEKLGKQLSSAEPTLHVHRETYTIDCLYVGGDNLYQEDYAYPSALYTLIEHENGDNVEEEMWKLIHWRSPLKVLIFYDWNENEKGKSEAKREFAEKKIAALSKMLATVDSFHTESPATEYLFILGSRDDIHSIPFWRCWGRLGTFELERTIGES